MNNNGKEGELLFQQQLQQWGYEVQDVSADERYYHKGDFVFTDATGAQKIVEVKWDERMNETKNLYLEIINTRSTWCLGNGWWNYCKADYVAYGDAVSKQFRIYNLKELRERVAQLPKRYGYCSTNSAGLLVNVKSVQDLEIQKL